MSSLPSFFLLPSAFHDNTITIHDAEVIRQMRKVLRLKPGDAFIALDGKGHEYTARVAVLQRDVVRASVIGDGVNTREPRIAVVLYPALIRRERFATILEKCTELGVARFVPIAAERSPYRDCSGHLRERWEHIIREAAEVARRGILPALAFATRLAAVLSAIPSEDALVVLGTQQNPPAGGMKKASAISGMLDRKHCAHVFIGPEGDYTEEEYAALKNRGASFLTLGPRIVRSETAAIAAAALFTSLQ